MIQYLVSIYQQTLIKRAKSLSKSSQALVAMTKKSKLYFILSLLLVSMLSITNAQAASCKLPKSYYKNVSCTSNSNYFLAIKDFGAPVALIDGKGKPVVDLSRYDKVAGDKIAGDLIPVQRSNKVGYVNMQGQEVIPVIYNPLNESAGWARAVSDGLIIVKKDGKYGVINTSNQTIVPFSSTFSDIGNYRNGTAKANKNKVISWLDKNGNTVSDPDAKIDSANGSSPGSIPPSIQSAPKIFTTLQPQQQDGKWGFVDDNNVTMITYSFDEVKPFSEGLAGVRVDDKWGFINLGGELVIPFRFDNSAIPDSGDYKGVPAFVFTDHKAWFANLENGTKMCISKEGFNVSCD